MVALAWITGVFGGLCMAMGVVTAAEAVPLLSAEFTWLFWFGLSVILFLASIVFTLGRGEY
jgi:hypothetical protein